MCAWCTSTCMCAWRETGAAVHVHQDAYKAARPLPWQTENTRMLERHTRCNRAGNGRESDEDLTGRSSEKSWLPVWTNGDEFRRRKGLAGDEEEDAGGAIVDPGSIPSVCTKRMTRRSSWCARTGSRGTIAAAPRRQQCTCSVATEENKGRDRRKGGGGWRGRRGRGKG